MKIRPSTKQAQQKPAPHKPLMSARQLRALTASQPRLSHDEVVAQVRRSLKRA